MILVFDFSFVFTQRAYVELIFEILSMFFTFTYDKIVISSYTKHIITHITNITHIETSSMSQKH